MVKERFKSIICIPIFGKCRSRKIRKCTKKSEYAKIFGRHQYPKFITDANNILSKHKIEVQVKKQHIRSANKNNEANNVTDITSEEIPLSFTQIEGRCYYCG